MELPISFNFVITNPHLILISVPPRFENKFRSETARKGDVVRLKCEATGDHPMTIVWNIDKQPLTPAEDPRYEGPHKPLLW